MPMSRSRGGLSARSAAGLLVLVGIGALDTVRDIDWMAEKIVNLRIFETPEGRLDKSLLDIGGDLLLVSQFTLYGDCKKGRRPSFSGAMDADGAREMFELFTAKAAERVKKVQTGVFRASMDVHLVNDGARHADPRFRDVRAFRKASKKDFTPRPSA